MMLDALVLPLAGVAVLAALASAAVSLAASRWPRVLSWLSFPLLGVCALAALASGIDALGRGGIELIGEGQISSGGRGVRLKSSPAPSEPALP